MENPSGTSPHLVAHKDTTDVVQFITGVVIEVELEGHTTWFFEAGVTMERLGLDMIWHDPQKRENDMIYA